MGTRERKERDLETRKQLIIDKSRELFFENEFDAVTIEDICDAVEYGRSAIYSLFKSKEDIYAYVYLQGLKILTKMYNEINLEAKDIDGEFIKSAEIMYDFYRKERPYFKALFYFNTKNLLISKISPEILSLKEAQIKKTAEPIAGLLHRGIEEGYFKNIEIEETIYLFRTSLIGVIWSFIHRDDEAEQSKVRGYCLRHAEIYLEGIKKR